MVNAFMKFVFCLGHCDITNRYHLFCSQLTDNNVQHQLAVDNLSQAVNVTTSATASETEKKCLPG